MIVNDALGKYNLCIIDEGSTFKVILYEKKYGIYKKYVEETFKVKREDIVSYKITHLEKNTYLYVGSINHRSIDNLVFLGDVINKLIYIDDCKLFYGISSSFEQYGGRYAAYDSKGNLIYSK